MGLAHDKHWIVSDKPVKKAKKFTTPDGKTVYVRRKSDKGSRLYKPTRYDVKQKDVMPRYKLNKSPTGSIADVKAKGVWRDGRWYLEIARKLNTGNADDAVISAKGSIEIAVAAFNAVDGRTSTAPPGSLPSTPACPVPEAMEWGLGSGRLHPLLRNLGFNRQD